MDARVYPEQRLIARLAAVAGNLPRHIAMQPRGAKKYDWQKDSLGRDLPLTPGRLWAHLMGRRTLGSELRHRTADGRIVTHALC